jgi:hypothetical protein
MSDALNCEFIVMGLFDALCQRAFAQTKEHLHNGHHKLLPIFGVERRILESKMISAFLEIPTEMRLHVSVFCNFSLPITLMKTLCGLVVRVLGYRSGGPGSIPGTGSTQPRE